MHEIKIPLLRHYIQRLSQITMYIRESLSNDLRVDLSNNAIYINARFQ